MTIRKRCKVIGADGKEIKLSPGDYWPLPYRGAKFTVKTIENHLCVNWTRYDQILSTSSSDFPGELILALRSIGKCSGSFVITAHKEILTKIQDDSENWVPYYVGIYDDSIEFKNLDLNPNDLEKGMYWTGLTFKSGETWHVSPRGVGYQLMWRKKGITFGSISIYPKLFRAYLDIRSVGGRLYFTPSGHIWMNLKDSEVSAKYAEEFQDKQQRQLNRLKDEGNHVPLRLINMRVAGIHGYRPIYLGHVTEFDDGRPPITSFSSNYYGFGDGGEGKSDDASFKDERWNRR